MILSLNLNILAMVNLGLTLVLFCGVLWSTAQFRVTAFFAQDIYRKEGLEGKARRIKWTHLLCLALIFALFVLQLLLYGVVSFS